MNSATRPEPSDLTESQLAERLLEYDAALAAGNRPAPMVSDELPDDFREGFSCLEMLERLRLSDRIAAVLAPRSGETRQDHSPSNGSTEQPGLRTNEEAKVPAQLGRFQILKVIGQGGCGVVFLAHDPALNRQVAVKIPRPEALLTPELRQRFLREGRAAACLDHPSIVTVFEAGEIGAICYLASAYCPGITLREWLLQNGGSVSPRAAATLVATLAGAMHYSHQNGVCHRDLKPSNILLLSLTREGEAPSEPTINGEGREGSAGASPSPFGSKRQSEATLSPTRPPLRDLQSAIPKIIDFGLAKLFQGDSGEAGTRSGAVFGTPHYMAPEQAQGQTRLIGPATDIHALGVILYELLTGHLPYQGDTDLEILGQVVAAEPGSPHRLRPGVPRDLETICLKCLEKQPEKRYGSMRELGEDLTRYLEGRPIHARRIGWAARAAKWARRRPRATGAGALTGVLLCSLVAGLIGISRRESAHRAEMIKASQEIGLQKARADEQDWMERNQQYAAQIKSGGLLKSEGQLAKLRDLLLEQQPRPGQKDVRGFEWHYLWRFGQGFMLPDRASAVTALAYSQSGDICASGSPDGIIHLFDRRTGKILAKLREHAFRVETLDFLKNDTQLLSTAFDLTPDRTGFRGEFILWSMGAEAKILRRGNYSHQWTGLGHSIFAPARAANVLFVIDRGSIFHRLLMVNLDNGTEQELLRQDNLYLAVASPDAERIAAVHFEGHPGEFFVLDLLEASTKRRIATDRIGKSIHTAAFSPDGRSLALGVGAWNLRRLVEIRDVPSLRLRKSIEFSLPPENPVYDWSGDRLAFNTDDHRIHFFDAQSGSLLSAYRENVNTKLAFSPDGQEIALGSSDGRVRTGKNVFDPQDQSLPGPLPKSEAWCVAFSPDGNTLAAGYDHTSGLEHETLRLWDLTTKQAKTLTSHEATVIAVAVSPDGKTAATAGYDRTVRLWDMSAGKCFRELSGHTETVRALAFSSTGTRVASAGFDRSIKLWSVRDGSLERSWPGHDDTIRSLAFVPGGNLLVSAANDRAIKIWNAEDGTLVRAIADESKVQAVACSPDGSLLASGNENNTVELWELGTGSLRRTLPGHSGKVRSVAFSPDGKTLASGGEDRTVRLWNVVSGQELLVLPTEHVVNGLAFHPRRPVLAAAIHDGTVKIWSGE